MSQHTFKDLLIAITSSMSPKPYACCQISSVVLPWIDTILKIFLSQLHHRCLQNLMLGGQGGQGGQDGQGAQGGQGGRGGQGGHGGQGRQGRQGGLIQI